ncbi:MAG TPA: 2'-5' RNA ligase family protein [Mucilaginibacter sp.]|jgi:2'-5' RNA ligase|nr:2'-5' RNA ligase family protein [Mucilaginibacter sp.]
MTSYQDYLAILSPPENICNYIKNLKDFSAQIIGEFPSQHSKPHLSVQFLPRKKPVWIEPLMPKLERELQTLPPVELQINGFAYFDQQEFQTIYAKLNSTPATKLWFKLLRKFFNTPPFEPHITIARNIPHDDFKVLWQHFKDQPFNARFKVKELTILRRETIGHNKTYMVYKEMPFNHRLDFDAFTRAKLKPPAQIVNRNDEQQISLF